MPRRKSSRSSRQSASGKSRKFLGFLEWVSSIAVFLSVGFAMIGGTFTLPYWLGGNITTIIVGWIIVIATFAEIIVEVYGR